MNMNWSEYLVNMVEERKEKARLKDQMEKDRDSALDKLMCEANKVLAKAFKCIGEKYSSNKNGSWNVICGSLELTVYASVSDNAVAFSTKDYSHLAGPIGQIDLPIYKNIKGTNLIGDSTADDICHHIVECYRLYLDKKDAFDELFEFF